MIRHRLRGGAGVLVLAGLGGLHFQAMAADFDWTVPPPAAARTNPAAFFTPAERERLFPKPVYTPDMTGVDTNRVKAPPPPGLHPRLLIVPDDLPEIRARIKTSRAAAVAYEKLCGETADFFNAGDSVDRKEISVIKERPGLDEAAAGEAGLSLEAVPAKVLEKTAIQQLVDGTATADLVADEGKGAADGRRIEVTGLLARNALRALIDQDAKRGTRVAAALSGYAKLCLERLGKGQSIGAYRPMRDLALAYDYAAPFMTEVQRQPVRQAMATGLKDPARLLDGALYGVGHPRPSHNWITLVTHYALWMNLAIEGEEGYNPQITTAIAECNLRWLHYFWGPEGCSFEGLGKNQLNTMTLVALARRGDWQICHPHVRRAIDRFYPSIIQPWGYEMTVHSGWGGSHNPLRLFDILPVKWLLPNDPVVDFVYRNAVGDDYSQIDSMSVVFACDWSGPKDWEAHAAQANMPVNYVDPRRAMLCARSAWRKDAAWLQFLGDQQVTAHMQSEIGNFLLSSHGRVWGAFIHANDSVGASSYHSVLLVDGVQQGGLGRMVAANSGKSACFATVDWAPAYNGYVTARDRKPTENDYHPLAPFKAPYADWPGSFSWRNPWEKSEPPAAWQAVPLLEVKRALRTVGLVRGPRSYVLVVDDVEPADGGIHSFDWYMQVEPDVLVASIVNRKIGEFEFRDLLLASEKDVTGEGAMGHRIIRAGAPVLLVRLLRSSVAPGRHSPSPGVLETYNNVPHWPNTDLRPLGKRLKIQTWAKQPEYRVLLYPHRAGEELPKTTWENRDTLRVTFAQQMDVFSFEPGRNGWPGLTLRHNDAGNGTSETFRLNSAEDDVALMLDDAK